MTKVITKQDLEDMQPVTTKEFREAIEDLKNEITQKGVIQNETLKEQIIQIEVSYDEERKISTVVALSNKGNIYNGFIQDQYANINWNGTIPPIIY